jgi:hexosaminidase
MRRSICRRRRKAARCLSLRRVGCPRKAIADNFSADEITLSYGDDAGRQYGLTSLAQMLNGARSQPGKFRFPVSGTISDQPRYGWRGCHLDVSRQFYPAADIKRLIDILAWFKLNIFHWHLTDDEAWRLEIKAYPQLTTVGVLRGPDEPLVAAARQWRRAGRRLLFAGRCPRHRRPCRFPECRESFPRSIFPATIPRRWFALPDLTDGQEAPESYHSVQGYPNNALNPAVPLTYEFLEKVFDEMVELFPSPYIISAVTRSRTDPGSPRRLPRS